MFEHIPDLWQYLVDHPYLLFGLLKGLAQLTRRAWALAAKRYAERKQKKLDDRQDNDWSI